MRIIITYSPEEDREAQLIERFAKALCPDAVIRTAPERKKEDNEQIYTIYR